MTGEKIKILGVDCLAFEGTRKEKISTHPDYPVVYSARHGDFDHCFPCSLEAQVVVNHWGTVLAAKPLHTDDNDIRVEVTEYECEDGSFREPWTEEDEEELERERGEDEDDG